MPSLRFVFDQHVNARALKQLRMHGVDVVHVAEVSTSLPQPDAGRHVRSLLSWIEAALEGHRSPVENGFEWLR